MKSTSQTIECTGPSIGPPNGNPKKIPQFTEDTAIVQRSGQPKWAKDTQSCDTVYRAGDDSDVHMAREEPPHPSCGCDVLPPDIADFNFTSMGEGMRRTVVLGETWKSDYLTEPLNDLEILPTSVPVRRAVDSWRPTEISAVSPELIPNIKEHMKQKAETIAFDLGCVS